MSEPDFKETHPKEFQLVENEADAEALLRDGAKTFASAMVWTKEQENALLTHITLFDKDEGVLYTWLPKDFDLKKFSLTLENNNSRDCFFSVSLQWANIFFKTRFIGEEVAGLKFNQPGKIYKVQRRKDIRFRIPDTQPLNAVFILQPGSGNKIQKKLIDISASGLSFNIQAREAAIFAPGSLLKQIQININSKLIIMDGEIKYVREAKQSKTATDHMNLRVGVLFKNIRPGDSQVIASYVFEESRKYFLRFV
ncbi:MAG: PilZ domain-containing protein [Bdellovibrionota bacterium]